MGRPPLYAEEPTQERLATMLTPEEIARLVGQEIAAVRSHKQPRHEARLNTLYLKMGNPEKFDGKGTTAFNQWWKLVTIYLDLCLETVDRQKIVWIRTLLIDTALEVWHLHRYQELQGNDTWTNYTAAIRAKYWNQREAANA